MMYDILKNQEGDIVIITDYRESEPHAPRLVCKDGYNAVLFRNAEDAIKLSNINKSAWEALGKASEITIAECDDNGVAREYKAACIMP